MLSPLNDAHVVWARGIRYIIYIYRRAWHTHHRWDAPYVLAALNGAVLTSPSDQSRLILHDKGVHVDGAGADHRDRALGVILGFDFIRVDRDVPERVYCQQHIPNQCVDLCRIVVHVP